MAGALACAAISKGLDILYKVLLKGGVEYILEHSRLIHAKKSHVFDWLNYWLVSVAPKLAYSTPFDIVPLPEEVKMLARATLGGTICQIIRY